MTYIGTFGIRAIAFGFGLFMMYITHMFQKRKEIETVPAIMFYLTWSVFIFMSFFPAVLDTALNTLRFHRRLDFFIICGFMFLIILTFYTYKIVVNYQKKMEELVRQMAFIKQKVEDDKK